MAGFQSIEDKIRELNRDDTDSYVPMAIVGRDHEDELGTVSVSVKSINRYTTVWKGFLDFVILMQDYESGILLHRAKCPPSPMPISDEMAIHYMRYHVMKKGETVCHYRTGLPVLIPNSGSQLTAVGNWKSISTLGIFRSALSFLHKPYECCRGAYFNHCHLCRSIPIDRIKKGESCQNHPNDSRYWRRGNVITSQDFITNQRMLEQYIENHYEARSTVSLFPSELRKIRSYLLAMNDLKSLMLWCIIILGVRLFLRVDEVLSLTVESFIPDYFVVKGKEVMSLCVKIKGKTDEDFKHFLVFDDTECPELSAVRPLLLFMAASGRKSGYIFPTLDEIFESNPTSHYEYDQALNDLRYLVEEILKKDLTSASGTRLFAGTHMLRKTAFLLAYWGIKIYLEKAMDRRPGTPDIPIPVEDQSSILLDARHAHGTSTMTYLGDAAASYSLYKRIYLEKNKADPQQYVSQYKHIYVKALSNILSIANGGDATTPRNKLDLPNLSSWFVTENLNVSPTINHSHNNISSLWEKTQTLYTTPTTAPTAEIFDEIQSFLPTTLFSKLKSHFDQIVSEQNPALCHSPSNTTKAKEQHLQSESDKVVRTKGQVKKTFTTSQDFSALYKLQHNDADRVRIIIQGCEEIRSLWVDNQKPQNNVRYWYSKARKVEACVKECFGGDITQFISETKGTTRPTRFKCCRGKSHDAK